MCFMFRELLILVKGKSKRKTKKIEKVSVPWFRALKCLKLGWFFVLRISFNLENIKQKFNEE